MTSLRIQTPSRLHFGLLGWGPDSPRQFGGVGLMIDEPGIRLTARPAPAWSADGPLAERTLRIAQSVASQVSAAPAAFHVEKAPDEHVGLGVGTQLSLAVARAVLIFAGEPHPSPERLAQLTGRGLRSGIGLHGFQHGGFIVDGGHGRSGAIPPLLAHLGFPADWWVLIVTPRDRPGLHGSAETSAFAQLPPIPRRVTDRLCRAVLMGMMPALMERDLEAFGRSLTELQEEVGQCFAPAQGGRLAGPQSAAIVRFLRESGLHGVGQSSWGPTLYAFSDAPLFARQQIAEDLQAEFALDAGAVRWTSGSQTGSTIERIDS